MGNFTMTLQWATQALLPHTVIDCVASESYSTPFYISVSIRSTEANLLSQINQSTTLCISSTDGSTRYFNGIISAITLCPQTSPNKYYYDITIEPQLIRLKKTIHQGTLRDQSIVDTIALLMNEHSITAYDLSALTSLNTPIPQLTQFQESTLNFLHRICAEFGISYYFTHTKDSHSLNFTPDLSRSACNTTQTLPINSFGAYSYLHRTSADLPSTTHHCDNPFDDTSTQRTITEPDSHSTLSNRRHTPYSDTTQLPDPSSPYTGTTAKNANIYCKTHQPMVHIGTILNTNETPVAYRITRITHCARILKSDKAAAALHYENTLTAVDEQRTVILNDKISPCRPYGLFPARASNNTSKPSYPQVNFYWVENSAFTNNVCKVTSPLVGEQWGMQFTPREDSEVLVSFLYGSFNFPVLLGCLYNDEQTPPALLTDYATTQGLVTHDSASSEHTFTNAILFNDDPKAPQLSLHTQGNLLEKIGNTASTHIMGDSQVTLTAGNYNVTAKAGSYLLQADEITLQSNTSKITINTSGIYIQAPQVTFLSSNNAAASPIARKGDHHKCPKTNSDQSKHTGGPIKSGSAQVRLDGLPVACVGDTATCYEATDTITKGSSLLTINGIPVARAGDACDHGGKITQGSSTAQSA